MSDIDSPAMRRAGRDLLSLALMDARNHTLHLLTQMEAATGMAAAAASVRTELNPPLWTLGHVGWFQERWIARNLQRRRGRRADPRASCLASIEPKSDHWWSLVATPDAGRWALDLPDSSATRAYLLGTLESTLELLEKTPDEDDALYFYRLALFNEDLQGEQLMMLAQTLGLPLQLALPGPVASREPMLVPAVRWPLGLAPDSGFTFDNERPGFEVQVPAFVEIGDKIEIDTRTNEYRSRVK